MSDVLTGLLPYSSISSLSDQLDITTYGQALYDEHGKKLLNDDGKPRFLALADEKVFKKPSVKRLSRFFDQLVLFKLIEKERVFDANTGAELPCIIRLTDTFYLMCGETPKKLYSARNRLIGMKRKKLEISLPKSTPQDEIIKQEYTVLLKSLKDNRTQYRKKKRVLKRVAGMDKFELVAYGQRLVNAKYSQPELNCMNKDQYDHQVSKAIDGIFNKINEPEPRMLH